jgi:hypothetical protein
MSNTNDFYSEFNVPGHGADTNTGNPTTSDQRVQEAEQKAGGFDWGSAFGFGSSLLANSGQIASVFSPSYREDQIALAQAQQNQNWAQRNLTPNGQNNNFWIIAIVAIIVVVLLIIFLTKKK